jgi:phage tail sheath protein FI
VATVTSSSATPLAGTYPFSAGTPGTDGAGGVTAETLVGVDTLPRAGMYALRGQACALALLADADDPTTWSAQVAFGLSETIYMILTGPAGDNITNATTVKATAGIDSYAAKLMFGDWVYWYDQANALTRLVSPQGFVAGRLANLSPEQSSLNKPLYGVVGTQKSGQPGGVTATTYATADLSALLSAGIDVIANPQPGGSYWGVRGGHNSSSNAATNGDNYTRLTNYIATTLSAGMGKYVGQLVNATLFQNIRATLLAFLNGLLGQGLLGSTDGSLPFAVVCDVSNNPPSRTGLGYVQADVQVTYQAINEKFIVNVQGGQTVQVSRQTTPSV